jgi:hypothetical protein
LKCFICGEDAVCMVADRLGGCQFSPFRYYGACRNHMNESMEKIPARKDDAITATTRSILKGLKILK